MSMNLYKEREAARKIALSMHQTGIEMTPDQIIDSMGDICMKIRKILGSVSDEMTDHELLVLTGEMLSIGDGHAA